jgi:hypothetical protein
MYLGYYQKGHVAGDSTSVPPTQCNGISVLPSDGTLIPCTADSSGKVTLTYNAPAQTPAQGRADWVASATSSGGGQHAIDHYVYTTVYRFNPSPIATSGSLAAGAAVPVTLTAKDGLNHGVANSNVYLSFKAAPGGGSAKVGSTALTSSPAHFTADSTGTVQITYTAPLSLPSTGQDTIAVQDLPTLPQGKNSASYSFAASTPVISVGDVTVYEGDQNPGTPAQFTVTISPIQPNPVTVQYVSICGIGDKGCGEDFVQVFQPITVTIPANTTSTNILVRQFAYIGGNGGETYNEAYYVELVNPSVGVLGRTVGNGMLLPDVEGSSVPLPDLYTGSPSVVPTTDSGGVPLYFTVTLGGQLGSTVTFQYATANGSAIGGTDYTATSGTATILPGKTSAVIKVMVLPNSPPGSDKTFTLTISNATGGATISASTGTGTILAG